MANKTRDENKTLTDTMPTKCSRNGIDKSHHHHHRDLLLPDGPWAAL